MESVSLINPLISVQCALETDVWRAEAGRGEEREERGREPGNIVMYRVVVAGYF